MKHLKKGRKFGRETKQRKELLRELAESLILHDKITTTQAKAKSLRPYVEKIITKSKTKNLSSIKLVTSSLGKTAAAKMLNVVGPKYAGRSGGYTRILNLPRRISDGAKMAVIELIK